MKSQQTPAMTISRRLAQAITLASPETLPGARATGQRLLMDVAGICIAARSESYHVRHRATGGEQHHFRQRGHGRWSAGDIRRRRSFRRLNPRAPAEAGEDKQRTEVQRRVHAAQRASVNSTQSSDASASAPSAP